jgi:hypothetical protein
MDQLHRHRRQQDQVHQSGDDADGFQSGAQFAAVVHAAKNTAVPFVVLKHRVLNEKKSLAVAIHESKPELNAKREASKAWNEARQELSEL